MKKLFVIAACLAWAGAEAQTVVESFSGATFPPPGWSATGLPNSRWVRVTNGVNPTCSPHTAPAMARFTVSMPLGAQETLTTPVVDYSGASGSTPTVGLWVYRDGSSTAGDSLTVFVNTVNSVAGATRIGGVARSRYFVLPTNEPADGWYQYFFNVPPTFTTDTNYILFRGTARGGGNIHIDDVQWDTYPFPCAGAPVAGNVIASDSILCGGSGSVTLSLSGGAQGGGITYQWQSGTSATGPWTNFGASVSTVSTGSLSATTWFRCYLECANGGASDTSNVLEIAVSPNPNPVVTLSSGPNLTYCNGSPPVVVTASGAQTYTWSPNISISANGDTALVGPASNVTYNVTGVDSFGCSGQATLQVQVAPTPNVNANANQDTICPGNPVNLSATVSGGPAFGIQWLWQPGSLAGNQQTVNPVATTMYVVAGTSNMSGCTGYDSVLVFVYPDPLAGFSYSANGLTLTFTDTSAAAVSWSWDFGDGTTDTVQHPVHLFPGSGTYTVTLTVSDGNCTSTATQMIVVTGLESVADRYGPLLLFPNPAGTSLTVTFRHGGDRVYLLILDQAGREVLADEWQPAAGLVSRIIEIEKLQKGLYFLRLLTPHAVASMAFVKD